MLMKIKKALFLVAAFFVMASSASAATYYLAPPDAGHPSGGTGGTGTIDDPWHDLNYALNRSVNGGTYARVRPGDTLYLRGGVHDIRNMTVVGESTGVSPKLYLETTSAASPTTTIKSYPGEWAILDGFNTYGILHSGGTNYNFVFENFEVRNGTTYEGSGLGFGSGHGAVSFVNSVFRNIYFHDNGDDNYDNNPNGLALAGDGCIVEYCTFENNGHKTGGTTYSISGSWNRANLLMYEYYDSYLDIDDNPRKQNIVRYNRFIGSDCAIKYKGFGNNVDSSGTYENALVDRQPTWGDEIHHNLFTGVGSPYGAMMQQDLAKIHHNIFTGYGAGAVYAYPVNQNHDTLPALAWEVEVYNNTFYNNTVDITTRELQNNPPERTYLQGGYNWEFYNNLHKSNTGAYYYSMFSDPDNSSHNNWPQREDHSGFDSASSKSIGRYQGTNRSLAQWQSITNPRTGTTTLGANSFYSTIALNSDYSIPAGSAAIGSGRDSADLGAVPYGETSWYDSVGYTETGTPDTISPASPSGLSVL